jgi:hypothetical protein
MASKPTQHKMASKQANIKRQASKYNYDKTKQFMPGQNVGHGEQTQACQANTSKPRQQA